MEYSQDNGSIAKPILLGGLVVILALLYRDPMSLWRTVLLLREPRTITGIFLCMALFGFFKYYVIEKHGTPVQ